MSNKQKHKLKPRVKNKGISMAYTVQYACQLLAKQDPASAVDACNEIIKQNPRNGEAWYVLGVAKQMLGRLDEAIESHRTAIACSPNDPYAWCNLGVSLALASHFEEAEKCHRQAIFLKPKFSSSCYNLGAMLSNNERYEDALKYYFMANDKPDSVETKIDIGVCLENTGRFNEALLFLCETCKQHPDNLSVRENHAIVARRLGDLSYTVAHKLHIRKKAFASRVTGDIPWWNGEQLDHSSILLWADLGFGDGIQFARYASLIKSRGGFATICCKKPLMRIMTTIPGIMNVIEDKVGTIDHDPPYSRYQELLSSLPSILSVTIDAIPANVPYITAEPSLVSNWSTKLTGPGFKVGITWQGNPGYDHDKIRSFLLNRFESIAKIPGVQLYSLQKGFGSEQLTTCAFPVIDLGPEIHDFMDTAAIMQNLDLMIVPDTAVCHLSGALARPTWTLLQYIADWRWFLDRTDSPWYPTMRLFRQPKWHDWDSVFREVESELRKVICERGNQ